MYHGPFRVGHNEFDLRRVYFQSGEQTDIQHEPAFLQIWHLLAVFENYSIAIWKEDYFHRITSTLWAAQSRLVSITKRILVGISSNAS